MQKFRKLGKNQKRVVEIIQNLKGLATLKQIHDDPQLCGFTLWELENIVIDVMLQKEVVVKDSKGFFTVSKDYLQQ